SRVPGIESLPAGQRTRSRLMEAMSGGPAGEPSPGAPSPATRRRKSGGVGADVPPLLTRNLPAPAITPAFSPLLPRLYAPAAFGVWAVFSSITTIMGVIACLRYEVTIVLPESEEEGASQLGASVLAVVAVTAVTLVVVLVGRTAIVSALKAPEIG